MELKLSKSQQHDADVVVIEQRDKKTYLYITIASVFGVALGGLIGSSMTANKWQQAYHLLQQKNQELESVAQRLTIETEDKQRTQFERLQEEFNAKLKQQQGIGREQIETLEATVASLQQQNKQLLDQITTQTAQIKQALNENNLLNNQADLQSSILEQSRQVFQRELKVTQELEQLEIEKNQLVNQLKSLKKSCDEYLNNNNYQDNNDACVKQDATSARLSEVNQVIRVHQMDLKQIKLLTEQIGL
jgi:DNA repair exonuclease SbcCD ATPase subunit